MATRRGGGGSQTFTGIGNEADDFSGGSGNDTLNGGGGNDVLDGGSGNDIINGGTGQDEIDGGSGNDTIDGGGGADTIDGGSGADEIEGGGGADEIDGGSGADVINAGGDDDTVDGGSGADTINGGAGADRIEGGGGEDTLSGGGGNGNDVFVFNSLDEGIDTITDFGPGIGGANTNNDTIEVSADGFGGTLVAGGGVSIINGPDVTAFDSLGTDSYFFFDSSGPGMGTLYFDEDGGDGGNAVAFAVLTGTLSLNGLDIVVV